MGQREDWEKWEKFSIRQANSMRTTLPTIGCHLEPQERTELREVGKTGRLAGSRRVENRM
jgi:hypothetical protein